MSYDLMNWIHDDFHTSMNFMCVLELKHPNELSKSLILPQTKERALFLHLKKNPQSQKGLHLFAKLAV